MPLDVRFLGVKCTDPIWGAYSSPPLVELTALPLTPWLHLRGPMSKGRGGKVNKGETESQKRSLVPPNLQHRSTPLPSATLQVSSSFHVGPQTKLVTVIHGHRLHYTFTITSALQLEVAKLNHIKMVKYMTNVIRTNKPCLVKSYHSKRHANKNGWLGFDGNLTCK